MKTKNYYPIVMLAVVASFFAACKKDLNTTPANTTTNNTFANTASTSTVLATGSIAIGTTNSLATTRPFAAKDSIYIMNCYPPKGKKRFRGF